MTREYKAGCLDHKALDSVFPLCFDEDWRNRIIFYINYNVTDESSVKKRRFQMHKSTVLSSWYRNDLWMYCYIILLSAFCRAYYTLIWLNQKCHAYKLIHLELLYGTVQCSLICFRSLNFIKGCDSSWKCKWMKNATFY